MIYKYKLFWLGRSEEEIEESGNLDLEFTSSMPIEIGHHLEQVHSIAVVKSVLHNKFDNEVRLVVEFLCSVEEYGIR
jgi:hypothetical protein